MARKKQTTVSETVLFDVLYQDGSRTSNRKVPRAEIDGADGDTQAKSFIEAQDREIAALSGNPRGPIKSISRSGK